MKHRKRVKKSKIEEKERKEQEGLGQHVTEKRTVEMMIKRKERGTEKGKERAKMADIVGGKTHFLLYFVLRIPSRHVIR